MNNCVCAAGTLPWMDLAAFARRAIEMAADDRQAAASTARWVFFNGGLVDAAAALQHPTGGPALVLPEQSPRYHQQVFVTPPWPEIFAADDERRHGLADAVAEYDRLLTA